jgi:hypothetical protein
MRNADALSWHRYTHERWSLVIKGSLPLTGFALARSAPPSRLARLVLGGALVRLAAAVVTFAGPGLHTCADPNDPGAANFSSPHRRES